jgi:hypothetical protein
MPALDESAAVVQCAPAAPGATSFHDPPKEKNVRQMLIPLGVALALAASGAWAKAPAGATGECKDGTYTTSASKEGACSSHGGVKKWLAKEDNAGKASKSSEKSAATTAAAKPADATGECKDGTYTTSPGKSGACSGHKGVKTWYGAKAGTTSNAAASSSAPSQSGAAAPTNSAPGASSAAPVNSAPAPRSSTRPASGAAAGGGAGQVWVNTDSKVYHCEKDALYGKTKHGEYMSEAQAKASGARPSRGKECS